jgi:hypothetical protein
VEIFSYHVDLPNTFEQIIEVKARNLVTLRRPDAARPPDDPFLQDRKGDREQSGQGVLYPAFPVNFAFVQ